MPERLKNEIIASIPQSFIEGLLFHTPRIYQESYTTMFNDPDLNKASAEYNYPHYRRGKYETMLHKLALNVGCKATVETNTANNFKYTLVESGRILLAQSHVNKDIGQLRPSVFRKQHSEINWYMQQMHLGLPGYSPKRKPDNIFALILHSTSEENPAASGFVKIAVPNAEGDDWIDHFDALELFHAYVENELTDIRIDEKLPSLRKHLHAKGDE